MTLQIVVVHAPSPRNAQEIPLTLPEGSTVADAIAAAGVWACANGLTASLGIDEIKAESEKTTAVGVWGRPVKFSQLLRDLDRVEIYRPLKVDPKVARRTRFASQGIKKAGLFAAQRQSVKPGQ